MQIILMDTVPNLGKVGDVLKVKDGYARNYLLPRQMAVAATANNVKRVEKEKTKRLALYEEQKKQAQVKADELAKVSLTVTVEVNDQEKLYGAVSETEILRALEQEGFTFERKDLVIEKPVEELGIFEIGIKLHQEVTGKFRLWVTKK